MKSNVLDKKWHLSKTEEDLAVTDFEVQLWRAFYGFLRWQQECERAVNKTNLTGADLSVLHVIRMQERPKSIKDIARFLNRDDNFNIQYSIRKLLKLGLIKKVKLAGIKSVTYASTATGVKNTESFAQARQALLVDVFMKSSGLDLVALAQSLSKLKTVYEEAEHLAVIRCFS
jgi:predicted MarR family transcription regulator